MSTFKKYYDESYSFFNSWYGFINEQQEEAQGMAGAAAEDQARAQAEAQRKEQEIMALRSNAGPALAEFVTMMYQAADVGNKGGRIADAHITRVSRALSDLAHREIGVEEFLEKIGSVVAQTGTSIQKEMQE
tara:strand:+ start:1621 stop:2016 length:396 start_codon:yes stop_codon:yes gene_type:complete